MQYQGKMVNKYTITHIPPSSANFYRIGVAVAIPQNGNPNPQYLNKVIARFKTADGIEALPHHPSLFYEMWERRPTDIVAHGLISLSESSSLDVRLKTVDLLMGRMRIPAREKDAQDAITTLEQLGDLRFGLQYGMMHYTTGEVIPVENQIDVTKEIISFIYHHFPKLRR